MKDYVVIAEEFWHKGVQHLKDAVVALSDAEAKYVGHAVVLVSLKLAEVQEEVVTLVKGKAKTDGNKDA